MMTGFWFDSSFYIVNLIWFQVDMNNFRSKLFRVELVQLEMSDSESVDTYFTYYSWVEHTNGYQWRASDLCRMGKSMAFLWHCSIKDTFIDILSMRNKVDL